MKKEIHPKYEVTTVKCVCGNEFQTRSTLKEINVEICSACHPFFTGQQKLIDSAGRVERFMKKYGREYGKSQGMAEEAPSKDSVRAEEKPVDDVRSEEKAVGDVKAEEKPKNEVVAEEKPAE